MWGPDTKRNSGPGAADIVSNGSPNIPEVISLVLEHIIGMDIFGCWKNPMLVSWPVGPELFKWGR